MKKYISILICLLLFMMSSLNTFAAGGAISISDDSSATLFTGSASSHYLILSSNGVVSAWGDNSFGQCGTEPCDTITDINYIDFESKIIKVVAGNGFSIALDENNTAWGWGNNLEFQIGISRPTSAGTPTQFSSPQRIADNIIDVAAGEGFSILLNENGEILLSGLGNADTLRVINLPQIDTSAPKIKYITANYNNVVAIDENDYVFLWRADIQSAEVIELSNVDEVQTVAAGKEHIIIRCLNGENVEFYGFGDNSKSQLGIMNVYEATEPILVLSILYEPNQHIAEFAGEYNTVINVWNNLSARDMMQEYHWGTYIVFQGNGNDIAMIDQVTIGEPEQNMVDYQIIAISDENNIGFNFVTNEIIIYNYFQSLESIPIIEPTDTIETMYEYQYEDVDHHNYTVNFIKIDEDKFSDGNNDEQYLHWEYVSENQFKVKVKEFINGLGNNGINPAQSTIFINKELTGENRNVGTYGPSIWNFDIKDEIFKTEVTDVIHGGEDGVEIVVSAFVLRNREEVPLNIPSDVSIFYESPGMITENTKLGLYLYGLPEGTTGTISDISENTFKIALSGNSTADMDYDSFIKLCYIRTEDEHANGEVVGDFNLNEVSVYAGERQLRGLSIKAIENTPETLTISGTLTKGKENGKVINVSISGGTFAEQLYTDAWAIIGEDEISINTIERVDDNNVKITLSGNSTDKYTNSELQVSCEGSQYSDSRVYDEDTGKYIESELLSENHVVLTKQSRSTGGSVSSTLSKPTSNVKSGEVAKGTKIELLSTINNSKIYYTTDGTQPTAQSFLYKEPIEITDAMTIKFITVSGSRKSAVQTVTYTVKSAEIGLKKNAEKIAYIEAIGDKFYPDEPMNRYEVLSALNNLFDIENLNIESNFTDVSDEYLSLVNLFVGAGIIEGYPDNTFRGDSGITRAELVKILSIMLDITESDVNVFADTLGHWCAGYINGFAELELLHGYPDGNFKPDNIITKAEVITVLNRVIKIDTDNVKSLTFDDLSEKHWAYHDICAAIMIE